MDPSEGPRRMTGGGSNIMDGEAAGPESQAAVFHLRCGQLVSLSQAGRTASRSHATQVGEILYQKPANVTFQEFNHGLVLSAAPLLDNQMVEVRPSLIVHIQQKEKLNYIIATWN